MEKGLFTWERFDVQDTLALQFYDCILKVPIGGFKVGERISSICVDFGHGNLQLFNHTGEVMFECKLCMSLARESS